MKIISPNSLDGFRAPHPKAEITVIGRQIILLKSFREFLEIDYKKGPHHLLIVDNDPGIFICTAAESKDTWPIKLSSHDKMSLNSLTLAEWLRAEFRMKSKFRCRLDTKNEFWINRRRMYQLLPIRPEPKA